MKTHFLIVAHSRETEPTNRNKQNKSNKDSSEINHTSMASVAECWQFLNAHETVNTRQDTYTDRQTDTHTHTHTHTHTVTEAYSPLPHRRRDRYDPLINKDTAVKKNVRQKQV